MRLELLRVVPRPIDGGRFITHDSVVTLTLEPSWESADSEEARLKWQNYTLEIRWPIHLQLQLHVALYPQGGILKEHKDLIVDGERMFRVQFIPRNARRGGELRCEHFILNRRNFKIFEPARYRHEITKVEEGARLVFNFGIRYGRRRIRPCPF